MHHSAYLDSPPSYNYHAILLVDEDHPPEKSNSDTKAPSPLSPAVSKDDRVRLAGSSKSHLNSTRISHTIRNSIQDLLHDLVRRQTANSPAVVSVLASCAHACASHGVSFSDLIQQKYVEKHTLLYWVIVKNFPDDHPEVKEDKSSDSDILTAFLSYATPLNDETITDLRQACIAASNQNLFKRLRQTPGFVRMSGVDQMLLGVKVPLDEIEMEEVTDAPDSFAVNFVVPRFHRRMAISKRITLEFVTRNRLWQVTFLEDPPDGSWIVSLSLWEPSPPVVACSLSILEAADPSPSGKKFIMDFSSGYAIQNPRGAFRDKLESANSPFIGADGKLHARFERKSKAR